MSNRKTAPRHHGGKWLIFASKDAEECNLPAPTVCRGIKHAFADDWSVSKGNTHRFALVESNDRLKSDEPTNWMELKEAFHDYLAGAALVLNPLPRESHFHGTDWDDIWSDWFVVRSDLRDVWTQIVDTHDHWVDSHGEEGQGGKPTEEGAKNSPAEAVPTESGDHTS